MPLRYLKTIQKLYLYNVVVVDTESILEILQRHSGKLPVLGRVKIGVHFAYADLTIVGTSIIIFTNASAYITKSTPEANQAPYCSAPSLKYEHFNIISPCNGSHYTAQSIYHHYTVTMFSKPFFFTKHRSMDSKRQAAKNRTIKQPKGNPFNLLPTCSGQM